MESFIKEYGTPDFLINAVGYAYPEYVENLKLKDFKKNMDVNYYGQLVPTLLFLPYMIANNQGHISFI
ncbi:MAG: SDR family NAD(P)-dependent oxidoreductase, partial [Aliifodinibius sp.]|nr:SDR family NAD(P)-dependent oxidoreductase [Fodinibius sp.]